MAIYRSTAGRPNVGLVVGILFGVVGFIIVFAIVFSRRTVNQAQSQQDPEAQRAEQRRVHGGWAGQRPSQETTVERRARLIREHRASQGREGGIEREARREREAREGEPAPPMYQMPAPTYPSSREMQRQWLAANRPFNNALPLSEHDAPPAYDSPAVWPARG